MLNILQICDHKARREKTPEQQQRPGPANGHPAEGRVSSRQHQDHLPRGEGGVLHVRKTPEHPHCSVQ